MMASKVIVVTGPPGIGKTTVISKVARMLREKGLTVGGIISKEVRAHGRRTGFEMIDVRTGEREVLASVTGQGARMGRYRVNLRGLAEFASKRLEEAIKGSDVIVCDEVGPMELLSPEFRRAALKLKDAGKPVLVVVHYRMKDPVIKEIRGAKGAELFEVTYENRDELPEIIFEKVMGALG